MEDCELHTACMLRKYVEQSKIPNFDQLAAADRRREVNRYRTRLLSRLVGSSNTTRRTRTLKAHRHTDPYIHLTWEERQKAVLDVAQTVSSWGFARLFAECIDKNHLDPGRSSGPGLPPRTVSEQAFEHVVSRFEKFLQNESGPSAQRIHGLLLHDNNQTEARRHTTMMRSFHSSGTLWTRIHCILETPMFVDSELTRMVQIADLCP